MGNSFLPGKQTEIPGFLTNLVAVATANATMVALPPAMLTSLTTLNTQLVNEQNSIIAARQTEQLHVKNKDAAVRQIEITLTSLNKMVQGNANITPGVKKQMGLTATYAKPTPVTPIKPMGLTVKLLDTRTAELKWKRNGNKPGTVYELFAKRGSEPNFNMIASSGATKFIDETIVPGVTVTYQVRARRSERLSGFSDPVVLFPNANLTPLTLSRAA